MIVVTTLNDTNIIWYGIQVGHQYMYINTNNIDNTWAPYNTNGSKDESNIVFMRKSQRTSQHEIKNMMTCKLTTWTTLTALRQIKGRDDYRCSGRLQVLQTSINSCYSCYKSGDKSWTRKVPICIILKHCLQWIISRKTLVYVWCQ